MCMYIDIDDALKDLAICEYLPYTLQLNITFHNIT